MASKREALISRIAGYADQLEHDGRVYGRTQEIRFAIDFIREDKRELAQLLREAITLLKYDDAPEQKGVDFAVIAQECADRLNERRNKSGDYIATSNLTGADVMLWNDEDGDKGSVWRLMMLHASLYPERLPSPYQVRDWMPGDLAYDPVTKVIHTRHYRGWIPALGTPQKWDWMGNISGR